MSGTGSSDTVQVLEMSYGDTYTLFLIDSFGDGWNSGGISVGGNLYTMEGGSVASTSIECIDANAISFAATGSVTDNSATFSFDITNFTVGQGDGVDGHIHYSLNGGDTVMVYSADPLTLTDLPVGTHTIVFSLVDANHQPLDPAVESSVTFTVTECNYSISMVDSYGDGRNGASVELFANGISIGSFANTSAAGAGEAQVVSFGINSGDVITSSWTSGSYDSETSYDILDSEGNVVASSATGSEVEVTASCGPATTAVTFTVNTANIEVGPNGMLSLIHI